MPNKNRMNVVAESAGKYLRLIVSLGLLFLSACTGGDTADRSPEELLGEAISDCGYILPAAAYRLMNPDTLFSDPSLWAGQPAHYFAQRMSENTGEFEQFRTRFETNWTGYSPDEQAELAKQLIRWCKTYSVLSSKEEQYAIEELLYKLSEIEELQPIFREILGEEFNRFESTNSIDRFASLSSAQIYSLHQSIITSLSQFDEESFQQAIGLITRKL